MIRVWNKNNINCSLRLKIDNELPILFKVDKKDKAKMKYNSSQPTSLNMQKRLKSLFALKHEPLHYFVWVEMSRVVILRYGICFINPSNT